MHFFLKYMAILSVSAFFGVIAFVSYRAEADRPQKVDVTVYRSNAKSGNLLVMRDPELGWTPVPNVHFLKQDSSGIATEVVTDSRGLRVANPEAPELQEVDLLSVGCSQTWGQGVPSTSTFTAKIGEKLGIKVGNAGVSSYGSAGSLLMLRRMKELHPRVVLYGLFQDHFRRNLLRCEGSPDHCEMIPGFELASDGRPYLRYLNQMAPDDGASLTFRTIRFLESIGLGGRWTQRMIHTTFRVLAEIGIVTASNIANGLYDPELAKSPYAVKDHKIVVTNPPLHDTMLRVTIFALEEIKRQADAMGALLIVVYIPNFYGDIPVPMPPEITETTKKFGIPVVDVSTEIDALIAENRVTDAVIPNDGHISAFTHEWIADQVAAILRSPQYSAYLPAPEILPSPK